MYSGVKKIEYSTNLFMSPCNRQTIRDQFWWKEKIETFKYIK